MGKHGILQDPHLPVLVDRVWKTLECRGVNGVGVRGDNDVACVEQVQQRRAQPARKYLGIVVVLSLPVERGQKRVIPTQVAGIVALDVVEPERKRMIVDLQVRGAGIEESHGVRNRLPIDIGRVAEIAERWV